MGGADVQYSPLTVEVEGEKSNFAAQLCSVETTLEHADVRTQVE